MFQTAPLIREGVYAKLRSEILSCALAPGAELRESDLAGRFGVSTSPIRDALLRLEADGLVAVFPRKGYRVASISLTDAKELFELRAVIEQAGAIEGARRADAAALAALDRYRDFDESAGDAEFVVYNRDFHCAVVALSGNRRMTAMDRDLTEQFDRLVRLSLMVVGRSRPRLVQEHRAIIDALQARDGRRAARLMSAHVQRAEKRVLDGLSRSVVA